MVIRHRRSPEKAFLVLHGWENHRPPEHWQHWLANGLLDAGAIVAYPQLPDPDRPSLDSWLSALERQVAQLDRYDVTVVCHSLACSLWVTYVSAGRPCATVSRVALVSVPSPSRLSREMVAPFTAGHQRLASPSGQSWTVFASDDDPFCPEGVDAAYRIDDAVHVHAMPGAGHITPESGYGPWPLLLTWCLSEQRHRGATITQ